MNALLVVLHLFTTAEGTGAPAASGPPTGPFQMSPQSYHARRAPRAIKVDGRLDERAWKLAPAAGAFVDVAGGKGGERAVEAKLLWDEDNIYIAVRNADDDVTSTVTPTDAEQGSEDAIEVAIRERNAASAQLVVRLAANGAVSEQGRPPLPAGQSAAPVRGAVRVQGTLDRRRDRDRGWTAEIAIPAAALVLQAGAGAGRRLAWGDLWEVNMFRVDKTPGKPARRLAWSRLFDRDPRAADQAGDVRLADERGEDPTSQFEAQEKERERERDRDKGRQREPGARAR